MLKLSCDIIAQPLTYIFNLLISTGKYVDDWKRARVIPVYKTEDSTKCENYRPISILPIISKLFEKEVFGQLYQYLIDNSLLSRFQSGFRPKHSTLSLLLIEMSDNWFENMDNGEITGLISVDIRKAFDSIDHKILLRKMQDQFCVQDFELKWFQSYLTNGHTSLAKEIASLYCKLILKMKFLFATFIISTLVFSGHAASYWTHWLDRDNPSGTGDWETYSSFKRPTACRPGYKPVDANCRVKYTNTPWYQANEVISACYQCTPRGLFCTNKNQPDRRCKDYEIQFLCYRPH
ncbi:Hypothetical predicted protein [Paramuricea clavata]|uniref:Uncharacterized protein n=1 Tax=Paramuricea clavata TaxID=317549 RepID=A0A6S7GIC8_PARCT|nr:Hypothetical predicted protein [Paramuricea clavata]